MFRRHFFEVLAVALIGGSLFFFKETLDYLARRDYVAAVLVMVIGVAVISVGKETCAGSRSSSSLA